MARIQKDAAMFDLFDNGDNSQPGERQTDIEDIIAEKNLADSWDALREFAYEDSLLARIKANDKARQQAWIDAAKAGQVMRIC
jgi:hypothetical protein